MYIKGRFISTNKKRTNKNNNNMSIQTMQNNKKLYSFTYKEDEKKQLIKMMQYDGDLLFNGILPLDIEVKILKMNGYEYNYDTKEIMQPLQFRLIKSLKIPKRILLIENDIFQRLTRQNDPNTFVEDLNYNGKKMLKFYFNKHNKTPKQMETIEKKSYLIQIINKYNMHNYLKESEYDEANHMIHSQIDKQTTIKSLFKIIEDYNKKVNGDYPFNFSCFKKGVNARMNNKQLKEFFYSDN